MIPVISGVKMAGRLSPILDTNNNELLPCLPPRGPTSMPPLIRNPFLGPHPPKDLTQPLHVDTSAVDPAVAEKCLQGSQSPLVTHGHNGEKHCCAMLKYSSHVRYIVDYELSPDHMSKYCNGH